MVKKINRLSARAVATLTKPGRHADGGGLYLRIDPGGAKRWIFMWERTVAGRRVQHEASLGSTLAVPLAMAREKAAECRALLANGIDPLEARKAAKARRDGRRTFGQVASTFLAAKGCGWRNKKHRAQWKMTLEVYAKSLWPMAVDAVDTEAVLGVLQPIWQAKPETASRLRGRVEAVLDAARVQGFREGENPARWRGHLDKLLPRAKRLSRGHHAAIPYEDIPDFMKRLRGQAGIGALALRFVILTAARSGEVRGATWAEIDINNRLWVVPAARMKAGREHRVPLGAGAMDILAHVRPLANDDDVLIFPGQRRGRPLSDMTLEVVLRRMSVKATPHGFRSSFRDWAGDKTHFQREIAEAALAHVSGDATEQAYRRGDALEKRRGLMEAWEGFCNEAPAAGGRMARRKPDLNEEPTRAAEGHEEKLFG